MNTRQDRHLTYFYCVYFSVQAQEIIIKIIIICTTKMTCERNASQRLTLSWMARLLEGCTSTLCPAAVISLTCRGARGARLSHTLTSSRRMAMTLLGFCWWWWRCWDLRWQHMQTLNPLPWLLTRRSMTGPVSKTHRLQLLHTSERNHTWEMLRVTEVQT